MEYRNTPKKKIMDHRHKLWCETLHEEKYLNDINTYLLFAKTLQQTEEIKQIIERLKRRKQIRKDIIKENKAKLAKYID